MSTYTTKNESLESDGVEIMILIEKNTALELIIRIFRAYSYIKSINVRHTSSVQQKWIQAKVFQP